MRVVATVAAVIGILLATAPYAAGQTPLVDLESRASASEVREMAAWRMAFRPPVNVLRQTVNQLRPSATPAAQAQADSILAGLSAATPEADARKALWRAASILTGVSEGPEQEALGALAIRSASPVWSSGQESVRFESLYPAAVAKATYELRAFAVQPSDSATPQRGAPVRTLKGGTIELGKAKSAAVSLRGLPDGAYLVVATVKSGRASTELALAINLIGDLDKKHAALKAALSGTTGHEAAKQTAEYPYTLAKALRAGTREILSYDFPAALKRSDEILSELRAGRDPVQHAKGLQNRSYLFLETGELVPYQLYVPSTWTPDRSWPLIVALHGANLDETNMLGRADGVMQKLAEQHGFVVVAPLGYRMNSWYGNERGLDGRGPVDSDPVRRRRSQEDVLLVSDLIEKEYNIDAKRRYLTGNSMGGGGTWWLGGRFPERWAAIAPAAFGGVSAQDVSALRRVPILAIVGDQDTPFVARMRDSIKLLRENGIVPAYVETPGGTHSSAIEIEMPRIFEFFKMHSR